MLVVMAGLVPAIYVLRSRKDVDARHRAGHDKLIDRAFYSAAVFAGLPIAAFTRGITCSAISCIERLASAGSTQSRPA